MTTRIIVKSTLFQSIAGPLLFNSQGNLALLQDDRLIQHELIMELLTGITETFMEPNDGVGLETQLFDPNDDLSFSIIQNYIKNRLNELEQRIEVVDVRLKRIEDEPAADAKVVATLTYKIPTLIEEVGEELYTVNLSIGGTP